MKRFEFRLDRADAFKQLIEGGLGALHRGDGRPLDVGQALEEVPCRL